MNNKVSYSKKSGIISFQNNKIKHFDFKKTITLLQVDGITLHFENNEISEVISSDSLKEDFILDKQSMFVNTEDALRIFEQLCENKDVDSLIVIDGRKCIDDIGILVNLLKNKSIRFFIDIDWGRNEVHLLTNTNCYEFDLLEKLKQI